MANCMYSTHVVTTGQALKPNPRQCGMPMPSTRINPRTRLRTMAIGAVAYEGRMIFCAEKNWVSCEKPTLAGKHKAKIVA